MVSRHTRACPLVPPPGQSAAAATAAAARLGAGISPRSCPLARTASPPFPSRWPPAPHSRREPLQHSTRGRVYGARRAAGRLRVSRRCTRENRVRERETGKGELRCRRLSVYVAFQTSGKFDASKLVSESSIPSCFAQTFISTATSLTPRWKITKLAVLLFSSNA